MAKIPQMTKCQFAYVAETLKNTGPGKIALNRFDGVETRRYLGLVEQFADALDNTNSSFRRDYFLNACGLYESDVEAFNHGAINARHCALVNVPTIGESVETDDGQVLVGVENAHDVHYRLAYAGEMNSRQFSPWEMTAKRINDLPENMRESAWEFYELGVEAQISAEIRGFAMADYLPNDAESVPAFGD